jgi:hypothetical protein
VPRHALVNNYFTARGQGIFLQPKKPVVHTKLNFTLAPVRRPALWLARDEQTIYRRNEGRQAVGLAKIQNRVAGRDGYRGGETAGDWTTDGVQFFA